MKKFLTLIILLSGFLTASAQVSLVSGWKFSPGDSTQWSAPGFNDNGWQPVNISLPWEAQGHDKLDGFGWYRLHVNIPSSIKNNAFFKDSIRFNMGMGDDSYAIYLNGKLIG